MSGDKWNTISRHNKLKLTPSKPFTKLQEVMSLSFGVGEGFQGSKAANHRIFRQQHYRPLLPVYHHETLGYNTRTKESTA